MMVTKRARIEWLTREQEGRKQPPSGKVEGGSHPYTTEVRFIPQAWPLSMGWSLVVEKDEAKSSNDTWLADVHFLAYDAPHDELSGGRQFELFEGRKCVARGTIVGESVRTGEKGSEIAAVVPR